ncbi:MAG: 4Fe-4S dicluster domain-containing protein [Eggerthellaceae bacterium]|nr:4Fe-4S dicluster domain-containing protein [Eggerthellaceae bacterium]
MIRKSLCFDAKKCVGCYACAVACMDQNDIDVVGDGVAYRFVAHVEGKDGGAVRIAHVSMACMHCEAAECLDACPAGALHRDEASGAVVVRRELCIGCHACAMACPFGIPRFGRDGTMQKCDACYARTRFGYGPACAEICPTGALTFEEVNDAADAKLKRFGRSLV